MKKIRFDEIMKVKGIGVILSLVGLSILLSILSPYFLTPLNLFNVLRQISVIGILTVGQTLLMISGGLDLSIGASLGLTSCVAAYVAQYGINSWLCGFIGILVGLIVGMVNGLLVTRIRVNALITTLGMLSIARGIALLITGGMPIQFRYPVSFLGSGYVWQIPFPVIVMFVVAMVGHFIAKETILGRLIFAVGGSERAANLSGINVEGVRLTVFSLMGALAGLAGIVFAGNLASADPIAGIGIELDVIAAVVIGGTRLGGGEGSVVGSIIGAALMGVLRNGFVLLRISSYWQVVTIGLVIIVAVAMDQLRKR